MGNMFVKNLDKYICTYIMKARITNSSFFRVLRIRRIEFVILACHEMIFKNSVFHDLQFRESAFCFLEFSKKVFHNSNSVNWPDTNLETIIGPFLSRDKCVVYISLVGIISLSWFVFLLEVLFFQFFGKTELFRVKF